MPYIELAGDRLWARSQGVGEDVLLIAGLADDSSSWEAQTEGLSQRFRVTVFDNRGSGRSSTPAGSRWSVAPGARRRVWPVRCVRVARGIPIPDSTTVGEPA